jgi:SAM-dependent methyltransferase
MLTMGKKGFLPVYVKLFKKYLGEYSLVLDGGCGYGRMFEFFPSFCGIDKSKARIRSASVFPNTICCGDLKFLPFRDRVFPASCTNQVLMHVPPEDIRSVLGELNRVTRERLVHIEYYKKNRPPPAQYSFNHNLIRLYRPMGWKLISYDKISDKPPHGCWVFERAD